MAIYLELYIYIKFYYNRTIIVVYTTLKTIDLNIHRIYIMYGNFKRIFFLNNKLLYKRNCT